MLTIAAALAATHSPAHAAERKPKRLLAEESLLADGTYRLWAIRYLRGDVKLPVAIPDDGATSPRGFATRICKLLDRGTLVDFSVGGSSSWALITIAPDLQITYHDSQYRDSRHGQSSIGPVDILDWVDCEKDNPTLKIITDKRTQRDGSIRLSAIRYLRGNESLPIFYNEAKETPYPVGRSIAGIICGSQSLGKMIQFGIASASEKLTGLAELDIVQTEKAYGLRYKRALRGKTVGDLPIYDWVDCEEQ